MRSPHRTLDADSRRAVRQSLGVAAATGAYGVSFGALATASGLDVWQTCTLSLVMFTGGSQFAFVGVIGSGGLAALPVAIASAALLGLRNLAYAIRMSPVVGGGVRRIAAAQITIDESTAVALAQHTPRARRLGFWVTGVGIYLWWNTTTLAGALLGDVLGDPRTWGLDAAAAAAFLALLWPRLAHRQPLAVGVAAAVIATTLTPWLMPGIPVLLAAVVALVVGWFNLLAAPEPAPRSTIDTAAPVADVSPIAEPEPIPSAAPTASPEPTAGTEPADDAEPADDGGGTTSRRPR